MKKLPKVGDVVWVDSTRVRKGTVERVDRTTAKVDEQWFYADHIYPTKQAAVIGAAVRKEKQARNAMLHYASAERSTATALTRATGKKKAAQVALAKATAAVKAAKGKA